MAAQGVDDLRALPDQKLSDTKDHRSPLGLFALHGHETHRPALRRFANSLGICRIILLPLDEGLDVGGRDEPHLMAQLPDLSAPEVRASAGFHRDNTRWQLAEERQHLIPPQLLAQNHTARAVSPMHLKHILRQVEPDRGNLRNDRSPLWILSDQPWHINAVGGRSHHQSRDAGSYSLVFQSISDPVGVTDQVGQRLFGVWQVTQQCRGTCLVADLAYCHEEADRAAFGIGDGLRFCFRAGFGSADQAPYLIVKPPLFDYRQVAVRCAFRSGKSIITVFETAASEARPSIIRAKTPIVAPSHTTVVAGLLGAILHGRIEPSLSIAIDEDSATQHPTVIHTCLLMALRKRGLKAGHLRLC